MHSTLVGSEKASSNVIPGTLALVLRTYGNYAFRQTETIFKILSRDGQS